MESWERTGSAEQRMVQRACIVLESAAGKASKDIAVIMKLRAATVSKCRTRFYLGGLSGLSDAPRPGKKAKCDLATKQRILAQLDAPPAGYAAWTGRLVAEALEDVSRHQVWRVLRKHGIHLQRRHSWCIVTDPEFAQKAAEVVGLYLDPPENAVVMGVDEKPAIQVLERAQGWLRRALRGLSTASVRGILKAIGAFIDAYSKTAHPFEWTQGTVHPGNLETEYADLCN